MGLRIVFVRHGLSSFNKKGLIQGRTNDSYLTEEGYRQAELAGNVLKQINFHEIISSPLIRASETAKAIEKCFENEYQINFNKKLLEVDLDCWSGLRPDEIKEKYPNSYKIWKTNPENLSIKRSDNSQFHPIKELYKQAEEFLNDLLDRYDAQDHINILVIAHNAILRCLILHLIDKPDKGFRKIKLDNASISIANIFKLNNKLNVQLECLNQTSHLDLKLPRKIGSSRIILVRHGETNWNKEGRFQGQIDIPLNEKGKEQAKKASQYLSKISFNKAFSSSMSRPYETAKIILKGQEIEIKKLDGLVEISHGLWEGKLENEIRSEWPDLLNKWHQSPEAVKMPNGESMKEVSDRCVCTWTDICNNQQENDITLIVAHDAVNKALICHLLGIHYSNIWMIKQGNGGITVIDIFDNSEKNIVISSLNITNHLGGILDNTASGAL